LIEFHHQRGSIATCLGVRPRQSFHLVQADEDGAANNLEVIAESNLWMNGGFFVLDARIFDYMREGEELVLAPFQRLMAERRLHLYRYDGFWGCMDTYKEMQLLEDMYHRGDAPWELWKNDEQAAVEFALTRANAGLLAGEAAHHNGV
jgi:glucose-1-phosphate cytidylyltransferase